MTQTPIKRILLGTLLSLSLAATPVAGFAQASKPAVTDAGRASTPVEQSSEKKKEAVDENDVYRHSPMVQTIGHMFGMNAEQAATAFTLLNFLVLAALVGFFLARMLPKTFRNRNTVIQKDLVDARTATEEASSRLNNVEERLGRLDGQIAEMRAHAERDAAAEEVRIKASVEQEKAKILADAEQEIAAATTQAQRQMQKYAAELAIEQAARRLSISAETDRLLVQNFARRLGGDESKEGQN